MQSLLIVLSAVPVPTVASVVMAPPAHAEAPATGDVVFEYNFNDTSHNGNWDHNTISLRHDDGTTVTVSTILDIGSEKSFGAPLAISPDGSKIAFISDLNNAPSPNGYDPADLYVINSDGSGLLQLDFNDQSPTAPHFYDKAMTWSPDSTEPAARLVAGRHDDRVPKLKWHRDDGPKRRRLYGDGRAQPALHDG